MQRIYLFLISKKRNNVLFFAKLRFNNPKPELINPKLDLVEQKVATYHKNVATFCLVSCHLSYDKLPPFAQPTLTLVHFCLTMDK